MKKIIILLFLLTAVLFGRKAGETATLVLTARDSSNQMFLAEYTIFDTKGNKISFATGMKDVEIPLKPGSYDLKIENKAKKLTQWVRQITVNDKDKLVRTVVFKEASISLSAKSSTGNDFFAIYTIYDSGTEKQRYTIAGSGERQLKVNPGKYDIKIVDPTTKREQWEVGVEVEAGQLVRRTLSFNDGFLVISSVNRNKKPIFAEYYVYEHKKQGKNDGSIELIDSSLDNNKQQKQIQFASGKDKQKIALPPGRYDIKIKNQERTQEKWLKNVNIKGGEVVGELVEFD